MQYLPGPSRDLQPLSAGNVSNGKWVLSLLCSLGMLLPAFGLIPINLVLLSGLQSEEETESSHPTQNEATEERRLPPPPRRSRRVSPRRPVSACFALGDSAIADRSEYRTLNGTGAPLRC